ncbi:MAG: hypothetical protein AAFV07_09450 [Bacteroidota bacterium]
MSKSPHHSGISVTLALLAGLLIFSAANINWAPNRWPGLIKADARGYFAYLPAIFIYQDLNFGFFDEVEGVIPNTAHLSQDYRNQVEGKIINQYFFGTALTQTPFFLIGHGWERLFGTNRTGYSKIHFIAVQLGAICYLLWGMWLIQALLATYRIEPVWRILIVIAFVLGTNAFYYAVCEPGYSHLYSLAFVAAFAYWSKRFFASWDHRYVWGAAFAWGMIVLIRPINGLVGLTLLIWAGNWENLQKAGQYLIDNRLKTLIALAIALGIPFLQLAIYKIQTGHWIVYSYGSAGFNWLDPHIVDVLFSYRKGLFIYTPLAFLSLWGLGPLFHQYRFATISLLSFLAMLTYVLAAWEFWDYGGSFASRVYIEYYPLFALPLAFGLQFLRRPWLSKLMLGLMIVLVLVCQIQTYQYRYNHIHWSEMNKERYWDVFLRIDRIWWPDRDAGATLGESIKTEIYAA